jgi:hypothetical protein
MQMAQWVWVYHFSFLRGTKQIETNLSCSLGDLGQRKCQLYHFPEREISKKKKKWPSLPTSDAPISRVTGPLKQGNHSVYVANVPELKYVHTWVWGGSWKLGLLFNPRSHKNTGRGTGMFSSCIGLSHGPSV